MRFFIKNIVGIVVVVFKIIFSNACIAVIGIIKFDKVVFKRIIKTVSPGGGHIFSSSNTIHDGVPIENALAYIDAVKEYGNYPINIEV